MAVFRVAKGTMPKAQPATRYVQGPMGRVIGIALHVPSIGNRGPQRFGGNPPRDAKPYRAYREAEVFGVRCNPRTITGATFGDAPADGRVRSRQ